jgi:hypothetical protein
MKNELIAWKICQNGFDNCRIEIVHDLFGRWGMCKNKKAVIIQIKIEEVLQEKILLKPHRFV